MGLDVLVRILGDASDLDAAVSEADTKVGTIGTGANYTGVAGRIGSGLSGALAKVNWIGIATAAAEWLMEGMDEALAANPETKQAIDDLGAELDTLRQEILQPLMPALGVLLTAIKDVVVMFTQLVHFTMPLVKSAFDTLGRAIELVQEAIGTVSAVFQGLWLLVIDVVKGIKTELDKLVAPLADIAGQVGDLLGGLGDLVGQGIDFINPLDNGGGLGNGISSGGGWGRGSLVVRTAGDPQAVVRAVRTYSRWHGRRGFERATRGV